MKKSKPMRLAAVLLVIAILTTGIMYGTFAKYITGDSANDSARVAKFGVAVTMNGNLYGEEYAAASNNSIIAYSGAANTGTVQVDAQGTNVVAPGTKSDKGLGFAVIGKPEVDVNLQATLETQNIYLKAGSYAVMVAAGKVTAANFEPDTYYTLASGTYNKAMAFSSTDTYYKAVDTVDVTADYYPVVYSMAGPTSYTAGNIGTNSLDAVAALIAEKLNTGAVANTGTATGSKYVITSKTYQANTNLATALSLGANTISWAWDFDNSGAGTHDGKDTILGDLIAASADAVVVKTTDSGDSYVAPVATTDYNLTTSFSMSIKVTQID